MIFKSVFKWYRGQVIKYVSISSSRGSICKSFFPNTALPSCLKLEVQYSVLSVNQPILTNIYLFFVHTLVAVTARTEPWPFGQVQSELSSFTQNQFQALEPTNHHYCVPWWRSVAVTAPQHASSGWTWTWEGSILICKIFFKSKNWALRQCSHVGEVVAEYAPVSGSRG